MHNNLINLLQSADVILNKNSGIRANGNVASFRTQHHSKEVIHACCKELHELGFYLENVSGIKEKHIKALIENWNKRTLAISTMRENFSRLKQFCVWAKKEGIIHVHGLSHYLPDIDKTAADKMINKSKSWSGNGVDVIEKIMQTKDIDERWHLMLLMGLAFGLRRKEMLCIKPWSADKSHVLEIEKSVAKNGKLRSIEISKETPYGLFQRNVLDYVKKIVRKSEHLGWPNSEYKQNENRYDYLMSKNGFTKIVSGFTGHGLRAEFTENYALIQGMLPAALGGTFDQMPKDKIEKIEFQICGMLGHNNIHTIGHYYGKLRKTVKNSDKGEKVKTLIIDQGNEIFGFMYCNPPCIMANDGSYRKKTAIEATETVIVFQIESAGKIIKESGMEEFIIKYPEMENQVFQILNKIGLLDIVKISG